MANAQSIRISCIVAFISCMSYLIASEQCENNDLYAFKPTDGDHLALDATDPDQVKIQHFTGEDAQLWKFQSAGKPGLFFIVNEHHRKALDFNKSDDGHFYLSVNELQKNLQQKWNFDFKGRLVNAANGKHADIVKAIYNPGNKLILWENNGCACQEFLLYRKT